MIMDAGEICSFLVLIPGHHQHRGQWSINCPSALRAESQMTARLTLGVLSR